MVLPTVTSLNPIYGLTVGGQTISVSGSGFSVSAPLVLFGTVPGTSVVVVSDSLLTVVTPAFTQAGVPQGATVNVSVTTTAGTSLPSSGSIFYFLVEVPSAVYAVTNPFFDPAANYTVFGLWDFAQAPVFPSASVVSSSPSALVAGEKVIANDGSLLVFTLPVVANVGAEFQIIGNGAGGWSIHQNAGQNIQIDSTSSTVGTGGSVSSGNRYDGVKLICTVANTTFVSEFHEGTLTIV